MGKTVYTPPTEDCPDCDELINSKCIVEEGALPGIGMPAGSTASGIFGKLTAKIQQIFRDIKDVVSGITPNYESGLELFTYKEKPCDTESFSVNMPLFLNGKFCFEYDEDLTVTYTDASSYLLFFNYTHCSPIFTSPDDTVQILQVSGFPLTTPIVVKQLGDTFFSISDADKIALLADINTLTGSTFLDIVTDIGTSISPDLGLALVPDTGAGANFLLDLRFDYEVLDAGLVQINAVNETILPRLASGVGIPAVSVVEFSVDSMGGVYTFFDTLDVEITVQDDIDMLTDLILNQEARNICCADCVGTGGGDFEYSGADVDCGATNLATDGDSMSDILMKVCGLFDSMGVFNIIQPKDANSSSNSIFQIQGTFGVGQTGDAALFVDRIGCEDDITVTIDSPDGVTYNSGGTVAVIPSGQSLLSEEFEFPLTLVAGTYPFTLTWSACGLVRVQTGTLTVNP